MDPGMTREELIALGMDAAGAEALRKRLAALAPGAGSAEIWTAVSTGALSPEVPHAVHRALYDRVFADWDTGKAPRPAWTPSPAVADGSNVAAACRRLGLSDYAAFHAWSVRERPAFWGDLIEVLDIPFRKPPSAPADLSAGPEHPRWLPGARLNIADACFQADRSATAVIVQREGQPLERVTVGELDVLSNRVACALGALGVGAGDAVAIAMPMTLESVAAYLGILKAGAVVVSIADSFASGEIATRLRIAGARVAVTQDVVLRAGKTLPMYRKVVDAGADRVIVVPAGDDFAVELRPADRAWSALLSAPEHFEAVERAPDDTMNVLFSSGTTGEPKAIPWSHTTAIKCAMDGYYHHDIHPGQVVAWPTNIGWMMGPWLVFASLMNRAAMALYYGAPNSRGFCEFVQDARVNMLGVVPSLVKAWRGGDMTSGLDWSAITAFSSTGEASNPDDYLWLMARAGYKPVVEYCGGTEIGGGYVSQTLVQPASPSTFSTACLGLDLYVLDEDGQPTNNGELFIVPPSIGLSLSLLNRDHHEVYYEGTPSGPKGELLRRHGDQVGCVPGGYFRALGRADDTMNLGGIKVSSAEIERVLNTVEGIVETAAVAIEPPDGGPSILVVYAVTKDGAGGAAALKPAMQRAVARDLNPLFRVHDVVVVPSLPRTASNKVMRRVLRAQYNEGA